MNVASPLLDACVNLVSVASLQRRFQGWERGTTLLRKEVTTRVHVKQVEETGTSLAEALIPTFNKQIADAQRELERLGRDTASTKTSDAAANLVRQIFDPKDYAEETINRAFPVLARAAGEAAKAQLLLLGVKPEIVGERGLNRTRGTLTTKSTASEWLESSGEELPPGLATELPDSIKREISRQLRDTFSQDYWLKIPESTRNDIERFLDRGLKDGLSIRQLATNISQAFPASYSRTRATLVARTESGHALNGARKTSVETLKAEVPEVPMVQVWLSVLGFTTRDAHADLDGVPEDGDGMWNLNGILVPWPSHTTLPPEDRCNCLCSVFTEFGMPEEQAQQLISEHSERLSSE